MELGPLLGFLQKKIHVYGLHDFVAEGFVFSSREMYFCEEIVDLIFFQLYY